MSGWKRNPSPEEKRAAREKQAADGRRRVLDQRRNAAAQIDWDGVIARLRDTLDEMYAPRKSPIR